MLSMKYLIFVILILLNFTGFCQENNSLNNINISRILLPKEDGSSFIFKLSSAGKAQEFEYKYEGFDIFILYYNKHNFKDWDDIIDVTNIGYFKTFEQYNSGLIAEIPSISWFHNIRLNTLNGYKYADSFMFLTHEPSDMQLTRVLFLTTNNYYIKIMISKDFYREKARFILFKNIYKETPQYFKIIKYFRTKEDTIVWDDNNGKLRFADDLIAGKNKSKTANLWYQKTKKILNRIKYE
jgi:hypothetical protein